MDYRVEQKYIVNEGQIEYLKNRLSEVMKPDIHSENGDYLIRSVYFDDCFDSCLTDTTEGFDNRIKYRIRTYNNDTGVIKLERKESKHGYKHKDSLTISKEEADILLKGQVPSVLSDTPELLKRFASFIQLKAARPKVIVEYERTALVEEMGNVRITFDKNISGCSDIESFYDRIMPVIPVMDRGYHILEVKYDELIPDMIGSILKEVSLTRTSYSKYTQARIKPTIGELI